MGISQEIDIFGDMTEFKENVITDYSIFDQRNLFSCRFLSLRGATFTDFDAHSLFSLEFIDIRESRVERLDLR